MQMNYLFYDKYAGNHHYNNILTKNISIDDLNDGSFEVYNGMNALNYYNNMVKNNVNYIIPKLVLKHKLYKLNLYKKIIDGLQHVYTIFGVNAKLLEDYVINNQEIPEIGFLRNLCRYHSLYTTNYTICENKFSDNTKFIIEKAQIAVNYTFDDEINDMKEILVNLFKYQKCSIKWMLEKEKSINTVSYNLNNEILLKNIYFDIYNQTFLHVNNRKKITFCGGALIDEVGLGKTLQIIALSLLNKSKQKSCIKEGDKHKLYSKATLILCPNHLCKQWVRELEDKISKKCPIKVITILDKRHFNKYTYENVLNADFVIVSYTFLGNKAFYLDWNSKMLSNINVPKFHLNKWNNLNNKDVSEFFDVIGNDLVINWKKCIKNTKPLFQLINWHRIVIDEFHEIHKNYKYIYIQNLLPHLKSKYRWIVTATPFISCNSLNDCIDFVTNYENIDGTKIFNNDQIVNYLSTSFFRRNTKKSVETEYILPSIKETVKWLKFTQTERMMYNAHLANPNNNKFGIYLRQLCCHPQLADETKNSLSNCKSLQEIEKMMVSHYECDMNIAKNKVE